MMSKRQFIIEGRPIAVIKVGLPAYIQQPNGVLYTAQVVGIGSLSLYNLRFGIVLKAGMWRALV